MSVVDECLVGFSSAGLNHGLMFPALLHELWE